MRRLSARILGALQPPADDEDVVRRLGHALSHVRGRPVRLREAAFPPMTASGLWVDRTHHDLIVYERNTRPEHQLVIIGHEVWHMFQGHGTMLAERGPGALRAAENERADALDGLLTVIAGTGNADLAPGACTDAALHVAARSEAHTDHHELDADRFGFRLATDVGTALEEARAAARPPGPAARVQASMAHRFRRA